MQATIYGFWTDIAVEHS